MKIDLKESKKRPIFGGDVIIAQANDKEGFHLQLYLQIIKQADCSEFRLLDLNQSIMWGVVKNSPSALLSFLENNYYEIVDVIPFEDLLLTRKENDQ